MLPYSVLCAVLASLATPTLGAVHEQLASVPNGWTKIKDASDSTKLTLSVSLIRQNMDQLESKLMSLSSPGHDEYGQWMDVHDIDQAFPVADDSNVLGWLKSHGVQQTARIGGQLHFTTDVRTANRLLDTTFAWYERGSTQKLRTTHYSIPDRLQGQVELVTPTTFFGKEAGASTLSVPSVHSVEKSSGAISSICHEVITPECIREMYQVGDFNPDADSGARMAFSNFLGQAPSYSDLAMFQKTFNMTEETFSVTLINGGVNNQSITAQDDEANLDVQTIMGLVHPMPVEAFITGGLAPIIPDLLEPNQAADENEPYELYYEHLLSLPNSKLPQVISNSYGDPEQTVPPRYASRVCNLIGLMGLRGISILESSGDTGVGAVCLSNDGKNAPQFTPQFPGTCPYVTAVGGTQFVGPEVAWNASSGGFSNYFSRPWYQELAVENYLFNHLSEETREYYEPYTNFRGRGFPDVAAHSFYPPLAIAYKGELVGIGGTSAACPQFSSIIALLNSVRMEAGKPSLGFLNPLFYFLGYRGLHDIAEGGSLGCTGVDLQTLTPIAGAGVIPYASWNATEGWDPVTGLGTPDFEKLKKLVLAL